MSLHQTMWDAVNEEDQLVTLGAATERKIQAQEDWELALRDAVQSHSLRAVAPAAGVSHARVAQIVGRRG